MRTRKWKGEYCRYIWKGGNSTHPKWKCGDSDGVLKPLAFSRLWGDLQWIKRISSSSSGGIQLSLSHIRPPQGWPRTAWPAALPLPSQQSSHREGTVTRWPCWSCYRPGRAPQSLGSHSIIPGVCELTDTRALQTSACFLQIWTIFFKAWRAKFT